MKENLGVIVVVCIIIIVGFYFYGTRKTYQKTINALTSIDSSQVIKLRIYPKVNRPFGIPITFKTPDTIIDEFFQSLTDVRPYPTSRDTVSQNQSWFLEVVTKECMFQIAFYIPYQKGNIVVGGVGKFSPSGGNYTTEFQSRQLYQWYQTYSHRWLTPEGTPPAPQP